ncbi:MAG: 16S rRNA (cytosine(1402)-N(4))-methyltransferase RsmH [Patescibacteria group bacterium]
MHTPVLLNEIIEYLNPQANQNFIDCTFGFGGHSIPILKKTSPNGKLVGIEWDIDAININKEKFKEFDQRIIFVNKNFANLKQIVSDLNFPIHGILLDLGISSYQLDQSTSGFSFQRDELLDMRFNKLDTDLTAEKIINKYSEKELSDIFWKFGEEKYSRQVARMIVQERKKQKITTTKQLVDLISQIIKPKKTKFTKHFIHPATKIFQALRIVVNKELENLRLVLPQAIEILEPRGRLCVISFHSLEDKIVKQFFKQESKNCICPSEFPQCICNHKMSLKIINKKVIMPTFEEIKNNPRSRSAKMRIVEKL